MAVREHGDIKGIQGINVQESGVTQVSLAGTLNIIGATVTDVSGVATITIPENANMYLETVPQGSATYTFVHTPVSSTSFIVVVDSGIMLFPTEDYTYSSGTITFLSLGADEKAYVYVLSTD